MLSIQKNVPHFPMNFPMYFSGKLTAKIVMKKRLRSHRWKLQTVSAGVFKQGKEKNTLQYL
jgi:hypothetical protein